MKFLIRTTYEWTFDDYDLSMFNVSKIKTGYAFIEINTIEEVLELAKITGHELIIDLPQDFHFWGIKSHKENDCVGYIEIYDNYRE